MSEKHPGPLAGADQLAGSGGSKGFPSEAGQGNVGPSPDGGDPGALGRDLPCYHITRVRVSGEALIKLQGHSGEPNRQGPQLRELAVK